MTGDLDHLNAQLEPAGSSLGMTVRAAVDADGAIVAVARRHDRTATLTLDATLAQPDAEIGAIAAGIAETLNRRLELDANDPQGHRHPIAGERNVLTVAATVPVTPALADDLETLGAARTATLATALHHRQPYVGDGADGARRSAQIDREEALQYDEDDPRAQALEASALLWDTQAAELEGIA